jgi:hypothetical protein
MQKKSRNKKFNPNKETNKIRIKTTTAQRWISFVCFWLQHNNKGLIKNERTKTEKVTAATTTTRLLFFVLDEMAFTTSTRKGPTHAKQFQSDKEPRNDIPYVVCSLCALPRDDAPFNYLERRDTKGQSQSRRIFLFCFVPSNIYKANLFGITSTHSHAFVLWHFFSFFLFSF